MRQGRNSQRAERNGKEGVRSLRTVPAIAPRRGTNSKKEDDARRVKHRIRHVGWLRRAFVAVRALVILAVVTGGLGAAGWAAYRAFDQNAFLVLRQVDVVGNHLLAKSAILEKAGLELGTKLPSVPVSAAKDALLSLPGVGEVKIRRIYPSRIEISVIEKAPVAMGFAREWYGMAADGTRIPGLDWGESDVPVVDGFAKLDSARRAILGAFLQVAKQKYPTLYANFSQVTVRGGQEAEIILRDGRLKVLLAMDSSPSMILNPVKADGFYRNKSLNSLEFLQAMLHQQAAELESGKTVDLRVDGYAYVR